MSVCFSFQNGVVIKGLKKYINSLLSSVASLQQISLIRCFEKWLVPRSNLLSYKIQGTFMGLFSEDIHEKIEIVLTMFDIKKIGSTFFSYNKMSFRFVLYRQ